MGDFPAMVETYRAIDQFGSLDEADLSPWWNNKASVIRDPALKITTYTRGKAVLMIVANLGTIPVRSRIQFASNSRLTNSLKRVRDLEKDEQVGWILVQDRSFQLSVPGRDFVILLATP